MIETEKDLIALENLSKSRDLFFKEINKVVIGQKDILDQLLIALLSNGNSLLVGVPGLAKTLIIKTLSEVLDMSFKRIQFTPDLMPSDITGTELIDIDQETGNRSFRFFKGPVFANIVLADEINRSPVATIGLLFIIIVAFFFMSIFEIDRLKSPSVMIPLIFLFLSSTTAHPYFFSVITKTASIILEFMLIIGISVSIISFRVLSFLPNFPPG